MTGRDLLADLETDGILTVVAPGPADIDPTAALLVLEDAVEQILDVLRPALTADDRHAAAVLDLPALRGAAHLLAAALLVHQAASQ